MTLRGFKFSLVLATAMLASSFVTSGPHRMCSFVQAQNTPHVGTLEWVQSIVHDADLIVRARAVRYGEGDHYLVPVRSAGQRGSCYASEYRRGGEFLLLLRLTPSGYYTPYWALLSPVNEQIRGADDPWLQWVRRQRAASRRGI
ncbi:MAG: hypothetical protein ACJ796_04770 [Gemmatimonadaceae bacterium]